MAREGIVEAGRLIVGLIDPGAAMDVEDGVALLMNLPAGAPAIPIGGGYLYADSNGNLHYKGPNGTDTQLAIA